MVTGDWEGQGRGWHGKFNKGHQKEPQWRNHFWFFFSTEIYWLKRFMIYFKMTRSVLNSQHTKND